MTSIPLPRTDSDTDPDLGVGTKSGYLLADVLHEDGHPDVVAVMLAEGTSFAAIDLTPEQAEHFARLLLAKAAEARS